MTSQTTLRLDRLSLTNFRCFAECAVDLHPELTVLVANNGQGKTALLDAMAISLGVFVDTLQGKHQPLGFEYSDVHLVFGPDKSVKAAFPVAFTAVGHADEQKFHWSRALQSVKKHARTTTKDAARLRDVAMGLRTRLEGYARAARGNAPLLPLVAFYGTGRLWSEHRLTQEKRRVNTSAMGRTAGYTDCLSPASSFKTFVAWYDATWKAINAPRAPGLEQADRPERLIAAVEQAVRVVLEPTGWHDLGFEGGQLVVTHPDHGRLPLLLLSDGVRNMIALVADLAHRCVRLNPHFGVEAARSTPGVVLIDEVDMHLHPSWQQTIIELLRKAFPRMQFVVSTHSPQVLSTVDVESIRVLHLRDGVGVLDTPKYQTRGVESADVLAVIMGVDPIPEVPEARQVREYQALITDGKADAPEGRALRSKLLDHFGEKHPVMLDCDRLARFQAYRLRQPLPLAGVAER